MSAALSSRKSSRGTSTAVVAAAGELLDPADYRHVVSRTDHGNRVDPTAIIGVGLRALIRRIIINSKSVVIDMARAQRLFTAHARDAVMLFPWADRSRQWRPAVPPPRPPQGTRLRHHPRRRWQPAHHRTRR